MSKFHVVPWLVSKVSGRSIVMKNIPVESKLFSKVQNSYFADAFEQYHSDIKGKDAIELFYDMSRRSPAWINTLLRIRNKSCKLLFGLKDVGVFSDTKLTKPLNEYKQGDKLGIFTIVSVSENEMVGEDNDKHLCVQVAIMKRPESESVIVSTVVHVHNFIGKFYMLFVGPVHRVVTTMLLFGIPVHINNNRKTTLTQ